MYSPYTIQQLEELGWEINNPVRLTDIPVGFSLSNPVLYSSFNFDPKGLLPGPNVTGKFNVHWVRPNGSQGDFYITESFGDIIVTGQFPTDYTTIPLFTLQVMYSDSEKRWLQEDFNFTLFGTQRISYVVTQNTLTSDDDPSLWNFNNGFMGFGQGGAITASKTFEYGQFYTYSVSEDSVSDALYLISLWASVIEYGEEASRFAPEDMYFPKKQLYQWMSPQQLEQFEKMYPDCVNVSYNSAMGLIRSQIGALYGVDAMIAGQTNTDTSQIFRWIVLVLTAYNIVSPGTKRYQVIEDNFTLANKKLKELKTGASYMNDGIIRNDECDAWGEVVSNKSKMRG